MDPHQAGGSEPRGTELPERVITPNMLVAYNMARFRKAAGMTQDELGEQLGGWSKTAVSAAERSWDGKRVRQFDADLIADLASIFHVPFPALFLPPADDDEIARYVIRSDEGGTIGMEHYFRYVMPEPNWDPDSLAAVAYQQAITAAAGRYFDSEAATELAEHLRSLATGEQLAAALGRAQGNEAILDGLYDILEPLLEENHLLQDLLLRALEATPAGRALLDEAGSREHAERRELTAAATAQAAEAIGIIANGWWKQLPDELKAQAVGIAHSLQDQGIPGPYVAQKRDGALTVLPVDTVLAAAQEEGAT